MSPAYKRWYDHDPKLLEVIELLKNYQEELREKYNPDNLFKNKKYTEEQPAEEQTNSVAMVEYKETIFSKLKEWFRNLFNKKLK